jgi:chromosome partitioning protein
MSLPESKLTTAEFPEPKPLKGHGPAVTVSLCNQKGGVGKTTSAVSLGAALAGFGRKVLIVDFDPQGAASASLGKSARGNGLTIYDTLVKDVPIKKAIVSTGVELLDLVPANIDLSVAEMQLMGEVARESMLARALKPVIDDYDVILIDCQPSLGLLTINALTASNGVVIPLAAEYFALRGAALLVDTIKKVSTRLNPALRIYGFLITMYDARTLHSREVFESVRQQFKDKVFKTIIHRTVKFPDATVASLPITAFAPDHLSAKSYRELAKEMIYRKDIP